MAIEFLEDDLQPSLNYKRMFLLSMLIEQEMEYDDTALPKYKLVVRYRRFAVDSDKKRHFKPEIQRMVLPDYYAVMWEKAQKGEMELATALQAIEAALVVLASEQESNPAQVI